MNEYTEEQNQIIGEKFDALMESVFELIDDMYKRDVETFSEKENQFFDAFHEYIFAFNDEEDEEEELETDNPFGSE